MPFKVFCAFLEGRLKKKRQNGFVRAHIESAA
jgi:hypothetical protein